MSGEERMTGLLGEVDRPRDPRPEFAAALRSELLDDGDAHALAEMHPRRRSRRAAFMVAAAAALVVVVALAVRAADDGSVSVVGDRPVSTAPTASMSGVCRDFRETAFAPYTREQILSDSMGETVPDAERAQAVVATLSEAVDRLRSGIDRAGYATPAVREDLARIVAELRSLRQQLGPLAGPDGRSAASTVPPFVVNAMGRLDDRFRSLDVSLVQQGVPACL